MDITYSIHELEKAIFQCIFMKPSSVDFDGLKSELFDGEGKVLFDALKAIWDEFEAIDQVLLRTHAGESVFAAFGGLNMLIAISKSEGLPCNMDRYIELLKIKREQNEASMVIATAYKEVQKGDVSSITTAINELQKVTTRSKGSRPTKLIVQEALMDMFTPDSDKGLKTGIAKFDREYGGISDLLTVVAGYPGMGKSTFLMTLALNMLLAGKRVLYWSGEDSDKKIMARCIRRLSAGTDADQLNRAASKLQDMPFIIDETPAINGDQLTDIARKYQKDQGIDVVLIDHLGKLRGKGNSIYEQRTEISGKVADMQKILNVPVIAAHQLKRPTGNVGALPAITDLRDSGWIEADARQIVLLHRPYYYFQIGQTQEEADKHELCLIVGKNNHGTTGRTKVYCDMSRYYIGDPPTTEPTKGSWHDDY